MSLLYKNGTKQIALAILWDRATGVVAHKNATVAFWLHYLSKYAFVGPDWVVTEELDPAIKNLRRVDLTVKYFDNELRIRVFCVLEAERRSTGPAHAMACENEAENACSQYLATHDLELVHAITVCGTRMRAWVYEKKIGELSPMFGPPTRGEKGEYVEANSDEAVQIAASMHCMQSLPAHVAKQQT